MRSRRLVALTLALLGAALLAPTRGRQATPALPIDPARYLAHVRFLASDALEGRGNGTPGLERAAQYIAEHFREIGLQPGGDAGTFFQTFDLPTGLRLDEGNRLTISLGGAAHTFHLGRDYYPLSLSPSGSSQERSLPLVFAGYGIVAPEVGYDDYADVDVQGTAVLVFTHAPREAQASGPFAGGAAARHAGTMTKAVRARERGARLLLVVDDPIHAVETGRFASFLKDPQAEEYGLPVVRVRRAALRAALGAALDLPAEQRAIDGALAPRSRVLTGVRVSVVERVTRIRRRVRNVIGVLRGTHPERAAEAVVIGAHYDHLGRGGRFSMAPDAVGEIHNGADDNASGTAALIELARAAAADRRRLDRTLVFIAFAGEELGLAGSAYYVAHPTVPLEETVAMINLDMIGRPGGRVLVGGVDTAPELEAELKLAQLAGGLELRTFREGASVGSSDDTSFTVRGVPAVSFFSGFHSDYHRPSDDWEKIEWEGGPRIAAIALELARRLASRPGRIAVVAPERAAPLRTDAPSGYGPYFGSVPDFASEASGVRFADVRPDSPAAKAGLRRGDVLIRFAGRPIATLADFTVALREHQPGDRIEVVVRRDGRELVVTVELGVRP